MNCQTHADYKREQGEAYRDDMTNELVGDQHSKFPSHQGIKLARSMLAWTEFVRQFSKCDRLWARGHEIEQDFEALSRELSHRALEDFAPHHEKTAHGIGDVGLADEPRQAGGGAADLGA